METRSIKCYSALNLFGIEAEKPVHAIYVLLNNHNLYIDPNAHIQAYYPNSCNLFPNLLLKWMLCPVGWL